MDRPLPSKATAPKGRVRGWRKALSDTNASVENAAVQRIEPEISLMVSTPRVES